jgi:hypothetical protein
MANYRVLWIDDEKDTQAAPVAAEASDHDIYLIGFKSLEDGIKELEKNYSSYDGVLLDAMFFNNSHDLEGTEDISSSIRAKERIKQLPKKFEIFVLSGQSKALNNDVYQKEFQNVYKKGTEEVPELFEDLKRSADKQEETQARHNHKEVFDVCTDQYLGREAGDKILRILLENDPQSAGSYLNDIRKVLESLFEMLARHQLIPHELVYPQVNFEKCRFFLKGKHYKKESNNGEFVKKYNIVQGFRHDDETHITNHVSTSLGFIIHITQEGSHDSDVDKHLSNSKNFYLINGVLYTLFDVLVWFKEYVDSDLPRQNWVKTE